MVSGKYLWLKLYKPAWHWNWKCFLKRYISSCNDLSLVTCCVCLETIKPHLKIYSIYSMKNHWAWNRELLSYIAISCCAWLRSGVTIQLLRCIHTELFTEQCNHLTLCKWEVMWFGQYQCLWSRGHVIHWILQTSTDAY